MAQKSIFWQTGTAGDGSSEYTQAEVIQWQREHWINDTTDEGIFKNYESALEVSGTATPVNVGTGAACVYGFHYWNTANISTAIPSPGTGTRIDRLVLQADWTNRQVRLARLPGVTFGGTAAPVALTQMDGTTWEIPLAQLSITTGGAITVTDERVMLHPNIEVETAMIQNSAVTTAKINNDAIDDTKAGNRIIQLYRRQGGSANDWGSTGTTTYTPTTIREQVGSIRHTGFVRNLSIGVIYEPLFTQKCVHEN